MESSKREILSYLENISYILLGVFLVALPLVFSTLTSSAFDLPKQITLAVTVLILLVIMAARSLVEGKVRFRSTPFDLPMLLFIVVVFVSAIMSINRYDALIAFVPLLLGALSYFAIVNTVKNEKAILFIVSCLVLGASLAGMLTFLSFFKIYVLPFPGSHVQGFNLMGSLLDQAIYLALVLPIAAYIAYPMIAGRVRRTDETQMLADRGTSVKAIGFGAGFVLIALSLVATVYMLLTMPALKPLILPLQNGFQIGFAVISQDATRLLQSFLFGSGFGTFLTDFTRFKPATYNLDATLWSLSFFRSSSFLLELLATTGFLGTLSFLFIIFRVIKERTFFLPLILAIAAAFLLPFSFLTQTLFFVLLGIFAALRATHNPRRYTDSEFYFVALRNGLFHVKTDGDHSRISTSEYSRFLPVLFALVVVVFVGVLGYLSTRFVLSDIKFQKSLVAAQQNNGALTYDLQRQAADLFPYRDGYWTTFSQLNLALANSIAAQQPKNSSPSAQVQQQILTLTQQSINAARQAVTISPATAVDWNNLSSIYRALIGFGQNADQFAVVSNQQAIALDPNNPQQYINLGGIYYQLQQWDNAINQFAVAVRLKGDFANAYYNLGHAYEAKGDLANALTLYQTVQSILTQANDKTNLKQISNEVTALQKKIQAQGQNKATLQTNTPEQASANQPALDVNKPEAQLPARNPQVQIPAPASGSAATTR